MYTITLFKSAIPATRISSYSQFVSSGFKSTIQTYLLQFLKSYPHGLSTRQISELSGIEIGSLTNPIKTLYDQGKIIKPGVVKNRTGRVAIKYSLPTFQINQNLS